MRPSLYIVYFGVGFTLVTALSMVALSFLRPILIDASVALRGAVMLAPLILGVAFGARVTRLGHRESLPLSRALKRALGLGGG